MTLKLTGLMAAASIAVGAGLGAQMAAGNDPALGAKADATTTQASNTRTTTDVTTTAAVVEPATSSGDTQSQTQTDQLAPVTTRAS